MTPHPKRPKLNYNEDALLHAVAEVKNKTLSIRAASEKYGVPHSTLGDRVTGRFGLYQGKAGKFFLYA